MPLFDTAVDRLPIVSAEPNLGVLDLLPNFWVSQITHTIRFTAVNLLDADSFLGLASINFKVNLAIDTLITEPVIIVISRGQDDVLALTSFPFVPFVKCFLGHLMFRIAVPLGIFTEALPEFRISQINEAIT